MPAYTYHVVKCFRCGHEFTPGEIVHELTTENGYTILCDECYAKEIL